MIVGSPTASLCHEGDVSGGSFRWKVIRDDPESANGAEKMGTKFSLVKTFSTLIRDRFPSLF